MHSGHGRSIEMSAVFKHDAENGLPSDDSQTSGMSEQQSREEKLDSVGFARDDTGVSMPAEGNENANQVGARIESFHRICPHVFCGFNASCLACADGLSRTCSIVVQGDLDSTSLAVASPSMNSLATGGDEHPVRGLSILVKCSSQSRRSHSRSFVT
jgi:hypothetical protein